MSERTPRWLPCFCALLTVLISVAHAQDIPDPDRKAISPVFEGWVKSADGSYVLSFGYFNRNPSDVELQVGPNNSLVPADAEKNLPTNFLPGRQRHAFHVTVPGNWKGSVTWTLGATAAREKTVGTIENKNYEMAGPMGISDPNPAFAPLVKAGEDRTAKVNDAVRMVGQVAKASKRESGVRPENEKLARLHGEWSLLRGPAGGRVRLDPRQGATTTATFSAPGRYVLRLRAEEVVPMGGSSIEHIADSFVTVNVMP